jgi:hypothetical protein
MCYDGVMIRLLFSIPAFLAAALLFAAAIVLLLA